MTTATTMLYRATYQRSGFEIRTRWYPTATKAQDALADHPDIGCFLYLGTASGDAHEPGRPCEYAPRNGGAVSIEERAKTSR